MCAWKAHCLRLVLHELCNTPKVVIISKASKGYTSKFLNILRAYEKDKYRREPFAFEQEDISELIQGAITLDDLDDEEALQQKVASFELDLIIHLGVDPSRSVYLSRCTHHGIWSIQFDHPQLWAWSDLLEGNPVTSSYLTVYQKENHKPRLLYSSTSSTDQFSGMITRNRVAWKSAYFIPRLLSKFSNVPKAQINKVISEQPYWEPRSVKRLQRFMWYFLARHVFNLFKLKWNKTRYTEKWTLYYRFNDSSWSFTDFKKIQLPPESFQADPFVIYENDQYHVFFEEGYVKEKKGFLSCLTINKEGTVSNHKTILEKPYHLSYPHLFKWNDTYFMIPESSQNKTIDLYQCVRFPDQWEYRHTLMENVMAYDATLLFYDDKWWMFVNIKQHNGMSAWDELFLFHANNPISNSWESHKMNPIVSDVRRSRPAGRIFIDQGRIIRPSQDSSYRYGYGLVFNEIIKLTESEYEEIPLTAIQPSKRTGLKAIHTYNKTKNLVLVDGKINS